MIPDADVAIAAAQAGAAIVRARFGQPATRIAKSAGDFATSVDLDAEQAIVAALRTHRPGDAILGEESGQLGRSDRTWLVDPLCGTLNFAAHMAVVAVNVALREGGGVVAAATADPFAGDVFWTDGRRAWLRRDGADEPLAPMAESHLVDLNLDPPFPNGPTFRAARLLAEDGFAYAPAGGGDVLFRPRVVSSTVALAWVAAGRRAAYVTDGDEGLVESVHFASGIALCQAAGCVVTGLLGQPLSTGVGGLLAAADQPTHAALLDLIRRQFTSAGRP